MDVPIGRGANWLAVHASGRWVVAHPGGLVWGSGGAIGGETELPGAAFAIFGPDGNTVGVATSSGEFTTVALGQAPGPRVALGFDGTGIAHSRLGWWLVSTSRGIFRIPVDGGEPLLFLKWGAENPPERVACSANGRLCAFASGPNAVAVFGVEYDVNCGAIVYHGREVGDIEFGPGASLGVGIGLGDGNKFDLLDGGVYRTDPPQGRMRNRWIVQPGVDSAEVTKIFGEPGGSAPPTPERGPGLEAIGTFVEKVLLEPMKTVRVLSLIGFVLCAAVLGILLSVIVSGAEGSDDVGVPLAIVGFLTTVLGISMAVRRRKVQDIRRLGEGLRHGDRSVVRTVAPVNFIGEGPGLEFELHGSRRRYAVPLDEDSRAVVADWLAAAC